MHRPAASDVDAHLGRGARRSARSSSARSSGSKRALASAATTRRARLRRCEELDARARRRRARRAAERGVQRARRTALGADAYWRQRTWKRVVVIFAGPGDEPPLRDRPLRGALHDRRRQGDRDGRARARRRRRRRAIGLQPGDKIVADRRRAREHAAGHPGVDLRVGRAKPLIVRRPARRQADRRSARCGAARSTARYRLGFVLEGRGALAAPAALWQSIKLDRRASRSEIGVLARQPRPRRGPQGDLEPGRDRPGARRRRSSRALQNYLWVLGLISLSLALLNLLPLLPLDGGHIVFSIIEGIRGRAVAREVYERVSAVGIALVAAALLRRPLERHRPARAAASPQLRSGAMASERADPRRRRRRSAAARPSSSSR